MRYPTSLRPSGADGLLSEAADAAPGATGAMVTSEGTSPAGELSPLSLQRLHRALRQWVLQRIFATSAHSLVRDSSDPSHGIGKVRRGTSGEERIGTAHQGDHISIFGRKT